MIEIRNLSKSYRGIPILVNWSMSFPQGGHFCVTGASGSGKTTLLRMIAGLEKPEGGSITISPGTVFSWMFQEDRLLEHRTAVENLRFVVPWFSREECENALLSLGIPEESLNVPVSSFSGGMKRRVAFARAVLYPGTVLLLDEPLKGLDPENKQAALRFLSEHAKGRTVLMITHDDTLPEGFERVEL